MTIRTITRKKGWPKRMIYTRISGLGGRVFYAYDPSFQLSPDKLLALRKIIEPKRKRKS